MSRARLCVPLVLAALLAAAGCSAKYRLLPAWESREASTGLATVHLPFESATLPLVCAWKLDRAGEGTIQYVLPTGMLAASCTAHAGKIQCASKSASLSSLLSGIGVLVYERAARGHGTDVEEAALLHAAISGRDIVIDFGSACSQQGEPGHAGGASASRQAK